MNANKAAEDDRERLLQTPRLQHNRLFLTSLELKLLGFQNLVKMSFASHLPSRIFMKRLAPRSVYPRSSSRADAIRSGNGSWAKEVDSLNLTHNPQVV